MAKHGRTNLRKYVLWKPPAFLGHCHGHLGAPRDIDSNRSPRPTLKLQCLNPTTCAGEETLNACPAPMKGTWQTAEFHHSLLPSGTGNNPYALLWSQLGLSTPQTIHGCPMLKNYKLRSRVHMRLLPQKSSLRSATTLAHSGSKLRLFSFRKHINHHACSLTGGPKAHNDNKAFS